MNCRRAAFLDRDGTLIRDVGYLDDLEDIEFLPGAIDAIRKLNELDFFVCVVTNQSGVARGYFSTDFVDATHHRMAKILGRARARVDAFYFCPHHVGGSVAQYAIDCQCRKPALGMFHQARADWGPFAAESFMFGDRASDIEFGRKAGLIPYLVGTGDRSRVGGCRRVRDLLSAVNSFIDPAVG
jgi:D-glycero-D-manno-heptose 1,7-bisphosphate phosphatase